METNEPDMGAHSEPTPGWVSPPVEPDDPTPTQQVPVPPEPPAATNPPPPPASPAYPTSPVYPGYSGSWGAEGPPAQGGPGSAGAWVPPPSPWGAPSTGWIPSSIGSEGGGGAGGGGGRGDGTSPGSGRPSGPLRRILLGLAAIILLAGVATAGVLIGEHHQNGRQSADSTIPNPASASQSNGNAAGGKLNVAAVAAKVDPAIVDITSVLGTTGEAAGTGMILTPNGDVLTNNHVVDGATSITAQIDGKGARYRLRVLGTDVTQDVALLQLVGVSNLPTVSIGNSSTLAVGDPVVAIGNALDLQGPPTVTAGIISALGRSIQASDAGSGASEHLTGLIQTDAPINPGNSGGALANRAGQVIGMNTAASQGSSTQAATNIGFAIPINQAISIAQQIEQHRPSKLVQVGQKGYIGVRVEDVSAALNGGGIVNPFGGPPTPAPGTQHGAYVVAVEPSSAAMAAGLQPGDVVTAVNGRSVTTAAALGNALTGDQPGTTVSVTWVTPSGSTHTASLRLGTGPTP